MCPPSEDAAQAYLALRGVLVPRHGGRIAGVALRNEPRHLFVLCVCVRVRVSLCVCMCVRVRVCVSLFVCLFGVCVCVLVVCLVVLLWFVVLLGRVSFPVCVHLPPPFEDSLQRFLATWEL